MQKTNYFTAFKNALVAICICSIFCQCGFSQTKKNNTLTNKYYNTHSATPIEVNDTEWEKILPPEVYDVARTKGTERPFTGQYWNTNPIGIYHCAVCGNALFSSNGKFESSCGWPSFFEPIDSNAIKYHSDNTHGMQRTEVTCGKCHSHLGHIFDDGPPPTYKRYCINSVVLQIEKNK